MIYRNYTNLVTIIIFVIIIVIITVRLLIPSAVARCLFDDSIELHQLARKFSRQMNAWSGMVSAGR